MKRGDKRRHNPGRPKGGGDGLSEGVRVVRGPNLLLVEADAAAEREGISAAEWWRRAARVRLGWTEVLSAPGG